MLVQPVQAAAAGTGPAAALADGAWPADEDQPSSSAESATAVATPTNRRATELLSASPPIPKRFIRCHLGTLAIDLATRRTSGMARR
jgi:hypothetical protein